MNAWEWLSFSTLAADSSDYLEIITDKFKYLVGGIYIPRNTNPRQYPLVVSRISCAPRKREEVSVGWRETVY